MLRSIRSRVTYANVVATMALFVAIGGTSYAALKITGRQVVDSSLSGRDIKNNSLTGADIANRSLQARDFKAGQLPAGPQGPPGSQGAQGPQGPTGKPGLTGVLRNTGGVTGWVAVPPGGMVSARATCPTVVQVGDPPQLSFIPTVATGGGWTIQPGDPDTVQVIEDVPYDYAVPPGFGIPPGVPPEDLWAPGVDESWGVRVRNTGDVETHIKVYVVCMYIDRSVSTG
jgi:hypothetical protein